MLNVGWLSVLAQPWFVVPWYLIGVAGAFAVAFDMKRHNRQVDRAVQWAWPIIVFYFSVIGIALYLLTSRPPGIQDVEDDHEQKKVFARYASKTYRKVTGSCIHCVGGDGLGIITAMIIARLASLDFWQEYWFEYAVGYAFGWFVFQMAAMKMTTDSNLKALWMGGRGEFFSMLTVMAGMGAVMGWVTPLTIGQQPKPTTFGFWGFAALGLLVGFVLTFPMNWMLVAVGWKHGIGMKANMGLEPAEQSS